MAEVAAPPEMVAALAEYAAARCQAARVEVRWIGVVGAPAGASWSFEGDPCRPGPTLRATAGGGAGWTVRPTLLLWVSGPVAPRDLQPGEPFVASVGVVPWGAGTVAGPLVALRALKAGDPVTTTDARPAPARPRGEGVSLVVTRGAVQITAPAVLLEDAYIGRPVSVRNVATGALQRGTVVDASTVRLGSL